MERKLARLVGNLRRSKFWYTVSFMNGRYYYIPVARAKVSALRAKRVEVYHITKQEASRGEKELNERKADLATTSTSLA